MTDDKEGIILAPQYLEISSHVGHGPRLLVDCTQPLSDSPHTHEYL